MTTCSCGNTVDANGTRCAQCNALRALELKTDATSAEIHSAYGVLSKAWDPDRFQDDDKMKAMAGEKLNEITAAYTLLTRGAVQSGPFRSQATLESEPAFTFVAPEEEPPKHRRKAKGPAYDGTSKVRVHLPMPLLIGCGVLVSAVVTGWFLFEPLDSSLMRIPVAGQVYAEFKTGVRSGIQNLKNKVGLGIGSSTPAAAPGETASNSAGDPGAQAGEDNSPAAQRNSPPQQGGNKPFAIRPGAGRPAEGRALPFITAGLSKSEVIAAQGAPTAESGDEMDYGNSKLYFGDGGLIGWRIDPSSPLRVKLWPDAMVDPDLQSFGMRSTKNDVLVVQGTPTMYSQNTFGYGKSEVYFQNGRVVGWKSDPATPLRTTPQ
jgi:hypothetical protein